MFEEVQVEDQQFNFIVIFQEIQSFSLRFNSIQLYFNLLKSGLSSKETAARQSEMNFIHVLGDSNYDLISLFYVCKIVKIKK